MGSRPSTSSPGCGVVIIARPDDLLESAQAQPDPDTPWRKAPPPAHVDDFRALLKATAMRLGRPIQILRRTTWDPTDLQANRRRKAPGAGRGHPRLVPALCPLLQSR